MGQLGTHGTWHDLMAINLYYVPLALIDLATNGSHTDGLIIRPTYYLSKPYVAPIILPQYDPKKVHQLSNRCGWSHAILFRGRTVSGLSVQHMVLRNRMLGGLLVISMVDTNEWTHGY